MCIWASGATAACGFFRQKNLGNKALFSLLAFQLSLIVSVSTSSHCPFPLMPWHRRDVALR